MPEIVKNGEKYHDLEEVKMLKNKWKKSNRLYKVLGGVKIGRKK